VKCKGHGQISATVLAFTWIACRIAGVSAEIRMGYVWTVSQQRYYLLNLIFPVPVFQAIQQKCKPYLQVAVCLEKRAFCLFVRRVGFIPPFCIPHRHMTFAHNTFTVHRERRQDVTVLGL
jgi:hypothetical protein